MSPIPPAGSERVFLIRESEPDYVVAAVDIDHLTGDSAGEVAGEEYRCAGYLLDLDITFQGRALGDLAEDIGESRDPPGGERVDRPGGCLLYTSDAADE